MHYSLLTLAEKHISQLFHELTEPFCQIKVDLFYFFSSNAETLRATGRQHVVVLGLFVRLIDNITNIHDIVSFINVGSREVTLTKINSGWLVTVMDRLSRATSKSLQSEHNNINQNRWLPGW